MNLRMVGAFVSAAALLTATIIGCSSDSSDAASTAAAGNCPAVGSKACPNEAATTQADTDGCAKSKADAKCGSAYVDFLKCAGANVTCDAAGKSDGAKLLATCKTQYDAYSSCVTPVADAGGD
jgi:hypothetical protein